MIRHSAPPTAAMRGQIGAKTQNLTFVYQKPGRCFGTVNYITFGLVNGPERCLVDFVTSDAVDGRAQFEVQITDWAAEFLNTCSLSRS